MYKVFIFLLAVLALTLLGSLVVLIVAFTASAVKDVIDDWRE